MELNADINILDSEILMIEPVLQTLNEKVGTRRNAEDFRREVIGRFEEIGFVVRVEAMVPVVDGERGGDPEYVAFSISISGRCDPKPFDYARQAEEVRADILGFGEGGIIKMDDLPKKPPPHHHH